MGSHGLMAKHVWYEESIGIPLVVGGGGLKKGTCRTLIGSPDFMPTILGLLELPIPSTVEGIDCSQDIKGNPEHKDHICFLAACPGRDVFLKNFEEAGKNPMDFGWRGVRTSEYVYIIDVGYQTTPKFIRYLYNLEKDPLQMTPEIIQNPTEHPVACDLENRLIEWMTEQKDGFLIHMTDKGEK